MTRAILRVCGFAQPRQFDGIHIWRQTKTGDFVDAGSQQHLRLGRQFMQCRRNSNMATDVPETHTVVRVEKETHPKLRLSDNYRLIRAKDMYSTKQMSRQRI